MNRQITNNGEKPEEVAVKPRVLRYAKREELAVAMRYYRLFRRITDTASGGTVLAGESFLLPDRAPLCKREVSSVCPVTLVDPQRMTLDLRNFYEAVDGIWCPDPGRWPVIFEFFMREGEALVENELDNMVYPDPAVVLFPE